MTDPERASSQPPGLGLEPWLRSHSDVVALAIVALGLAVRVCALRGVFVSPDETLQLQIASAPGLLGTYRESLSVAHPPLFLLVLHVWKRLVPTELGWRLLSIAFGTAFLWAAYRWAGSLFGKASALCALALLAFVPSLVLLSVEVRPYTLLLWLMAAALAVLERAFRERSPRKLSLFTLLCALCLLTHYSALLLVASAGVYAAVRIKVERLPIRFVRAWAVGQAALAGLLLFLYETQIRRLRGGALEKAAQGDWLRASYFQAGQESALAFCARQTLALFQFLFSSILPGIAGLVLLLAAVAWLAARRQPAWILLSLPFLLNLVAGLLSLYPYGGTRHSIDLAVFACAGIGRAVASLSSERIWVAIVLAILLAPAGFALAG